MGRRRKKEQGKEEGRKGGWEGGEERRRGKDLEREGRRKEQWRENLLSKRRMHKLRNNSFMLKGSCSDKID